MASWKTFWYVVCFQLVSRKSVIHLDVTCWIVGTETPTPKDAPSPLKALEGSPKMSPMSWENMEENQGKHGKTWKHPTKNQGKHGNIMEANMVDGQNSARVGMMVTKLFPWKLTWNLKMDPWKRRFLLETIIFRFHVSFQGCIHEDQLQFRCEIQHVWNWHSIRHISTSHVERLWLMKSSTLKTKIPIPKPFSPCVRTETVQHQSTKTREKQLVGPMGWKPPPTGCTEVFRKPPPLVFFGRNSSYQLSFSSQLACFDTMKR